MADDTAPTTDEQRAQLPPVSFAGHIAELAFTAQAYMGGMQDPESKQPMIELGMAKRAIDTLEMLQEKTKGNLEAPERNYLENMLYDLRMTYVRVANRPPAPDVEEAPEETEQDVQEADTADEAAASTESSEEGAPQEG